MKTNGIQLFNPTKQVVVADSGASGLFVLPVLDGSNLVNLPIQSGAAGSAATITIGNVTSGVVASVSNSGDSTNAVLDFVLPVGPQGPQGSKGESGYTPVKGTDYFDGAAATISVGTVTSGVTASVSNGGTSTNAILNFVLPVGPEGPQGSKGEPGASGAKGADGVSPHISSVSITLIEPNGAASGEIGGDQSSLSVNLFLPRGSNGEPGASGYTPVKGTDYFDGSAATIEIGTVTSGITASVSNAGTATSAKFNFVLPVGPQGSKGESGYTPIKGTDYFDGSAATIEIGTVTSGTSAFVSNGGTTTSAVLNFVLPVGPQGSKGDSGYTPIKGTDYFDGVSPHVSSVVITMIEPNGTASASVTGEQTNLTVNLFIPRGSQGIQGSAGPQGNAFTYADFTVEQLEGLRGPQGSKGDSGYTPVKGTDYFDGSAATIEIGTVTSGASAFVSNGGTATSAVLNFVLPIGPEGPRGTGKYFEYVVSGYPGDSNVVAWASSGSDIATISHGLETSLILNVCIDRYGIVNGAVTSEVTEQYNNYGFRTLGDSAVQLRMPPDFVAGGSGFKPGEWKITVMGI